MKPETKKTINPKLQKIFETVGANMGEKIGIAMKKSGLLSNDGKLKPPLYRQTADVLMLNSANLLHANFSSIVIEPDVYPDEIRLVDFYTESMGNAHIKVNRAGRSLTLRFDGKDAPVKMLKIPLNHNIPRRGLKTAHARHDNRGILGPRIILTASETFSLPEPGEKKQ